MSLFLATLLGVVQGLTEFIPVSSSAHLVLVPYVLGAKPQSLAFDVALHMGTAAAVVVYFRAELAAMARGLIGGGGDPDAELYRRLGLLVLVSSVPVGLVGFFARGVFEEAFANPAVAAGLLLVTAVFLTGGERMRDRRIAAAVAPVGAVGRRAWQGSWYGDADAAPPSAGPILPVGADEEDPSGATLQQLTLPAAMLVGTSQALALFPGISRSGTTISAGMALGLTREAATRFSFLLALPALIGAGIVGLPDLAEHGEAGVGAIAAGTTAALVSGYIAIRFLVALVARDRLTGFARYCVVVGLAGLLATVMIGPPSTV